MRLINYGCSLLLLATVLTFAARAQSPPTTGAPVTAEAAGNETVLAFQPAENEALSKILEADQDRAGDQKYIEATFKAADDLLKKAKKPEQFQEAAKLRLVALKLQEAQPLVSQQLQGKFNAWLDGVRARAQCPTCQADIGNRRLVRLTTDTAKANAPPPQPSQTGGNN